MGLITDNLTSVLQNFLGAVPAAGVDRQFLNGVKDGFNSLGVGSGLDLLLYFILILIGVILLGLIVRRIIRPGHWGFGPGKADQIKNPGTIRETIERSVTLRSIYDMEVFHEDYREIYKGQVLGVDRNGQIEMELSSFIDPNLDFVDKPVRVAFRMSRRGEQEFYQFDTMSRFVGMTDRYGRRERAVRLSMPEVLEVGQKRRYTRIKPSGRFSFNVDVLVPDFPTNPIPLGSFRRLHEAEILDISLGGLQAIVQARAVDLRVRPGMEVYANFTLPIRDLNVRGVPRAHFIKVEVVSIVRETSGRRVMSRFADEQTVGPNLIRLRYLARGALDRKKRAVAFTPATSLSFEDLARWLQAYQRYRIQEEKGLLPEPAKVRNLYTSVEHKVPQKYPPHKIQRRVREE